MKHTIRAFALGLATATALLTFTFYQTSGQNESKTFTDQEAIKHLENKNYHVLSQSSFENLQQKNAKDTTNKNSSKEKEQRQDDVKSEETKKQAQSFSLMIKPGMLTSSISEELEQSGIIEDQAAFEVFLKDEEYSRSIQIGTYKLNSDMTFEAIANKITGNSN